MREGITPMRRTAAGIVTPLHRRGGISRRGLGRTASFHTQPSCCCPSRLVKRICTACSFQAITSTSGRTTASWKRTYAVIFTATLYWADMDDPSYQDEERVPLALGPTGPPPAEIRIGTHVDGRQLLEVYTLDDPYDLPDAVYYRHTATIAG